MAESHVIIHQGSGAREVDLDTVRAIEAPPPTSTWFPVSHGRAFDAVVETLGTSGFEIERQRFCLSRSDARFFATLDLKATVVEGVTLAVGIRNSTDKSFPMGFCAGSRVFVCENLSFRSELLVTRKHTMHGSSRFREDIQVAIGTLPQFQATEAARIEAMRTTELTDQRAESIILRSWEHKLVSHRTLPDVLRCWREPEQAEFQPRTMWSLLNAFTDALKPRATVNPQQFARITMRLQGLLNPELN